MPARPVGIPLPLTAVRDVLKRAVDVIVASLLLLACMPVLLVLATLVRLTSPGPALFVQKRIGHLGREFDMYKFRTMAAGADRLEADLAEELVGRRFFKLERDPRVTSLGRVLRKYSLDELPQLYNVLRGDMSLVGPRPLLSFDVSNFPRDARLRRFLVKPGLTGLWQVSGRSDLSDDERLNLDARYVDLWNLSLDFKILALTPKIVISARGVC